jgi:hypothetical protein
LKEGLQARAEGYDFGRFYFGRGGKLGLGKHEAQFAKMANLPI